MPPSDRVARSRRRLSCSDPSRPSRPWMPDQGSRDPTIPASASWQHLQAQDAVSRLQDSTGERAWHRAVGDVGDLGPDLLAGVEAVDVVVFLQHDDVANLIVAIVLAQVVQLPAGF